MGNTESIDSDKRYGSTWIGTTKINLCNPDSIINLKNIDKKLDGILLCISRRMGRTQERKIIDFVLDHEGSIGLDAEYVFFDDDEALRLLKGLCGNKNIHRLRLSRNGLKECHYNAFLKVLSTAPNLTTINYTSDSLVTNYGDKYLIRWLCALSFEDRKRKLNDHSDIVSTDELLIFAKLYMHEHGSIAVTEYIEKRKEELNGNKN